MPSATARASPPPRRAPSRGRGSPPVTFGPRPRPSRSPHRLAERQLVLLGEARDGRLGRQARCRASGVFRMRRSAGSSSGVRDRDQVRHRVLDLGALVELRAADHAVGQRRAHEDLLQRTGLRVGAVEHRDVAVRDAGAVQRLDLVGDELRLVVRGVAGVADDLLAVAVGRPELLVLAVEVVRDDGVGRAVRMFCVER